MTFSSLSQEIVVCRSYICPSFKWEKAEKIKLTCFIFVLAIQPGAIFLSFPFPNNVPFRSDTKDGRTKKKKGKSSSIKQIFTCDKKILDQMDCRLAKSTQLNVRRRTANISTELASSSISVFVFIPRTKG